MLDVLAKNIFEAPYNNQWTEKKYSQTPIKRPPSEMESGSSIKG